MNSFVPTLIATLGLQPQVITRSLDWLLADIEPDLQEVHLIHTATFHRNHPHWRHLRDFKTYLKETYPTITCHFIPIKDEGEQTVWDVETPETAELAFKIIFNTVRQLKQASHRLHGLIAGGRKSMIVYTMISAQLLFDEDDQLWHLFSIQETQDPHVPLGIKDQSHLVEIPILHLAGLMPMVRELILSSNDPTRAISLYRKHENVERLVRLQRFLREDCDEIDQKILYLLSDGLSNRQIGDKVGLATSAVGNRVTQTARLFYRRVYGRILRPWPTHIRAQLFKDLGPLLHQLEAGDNVR